MIVSELEHKGVKVKFSYEDGNDVRAFTPYTQSYAICFRDDGKILIGLSPSGHGDWCLPGGTVEKDESAEQALIREIDEELSLRIRKFQLLGAQKVEYLNIEKEPHFQLRYVALVEELPLTPDPDSGLLWQKKAVSPEKFMEYIKWDQIGEHILKCAVAWFKQQTDEKSRFKL